MLLQEAAISRRCVLGFGKHCECENENRFSPLGGGLFGLAATQNAK